MYTETVMRALILLPPQEVRPKPHHILQNLVKGIINTTVSLGWCWRGLNGVAEKVLFARHVF